MLLTHRTVTAEKAAEVAILADNFGRPLSSLSGHLPATHIGAAGDEKFYLFGYAPKMDPPVFEYYICRWEDAPAGSWGIPVTVA